MPKISIIVPVYNTEKYIKKCLESLLEQTLKDIEIIIVNDGSTDNTEKTINEIIKQKNKSSNPITIKYFKKENSGLSDTRNFGVEKATGKYISFIDSDDYVDKNLYKKLEKYIDKDIDLIKFKMKTVDTKYKEIEKIEGPIFNKISGEEAYKKLCTKDKYLDVACIYLYKREFFINNKFKYAPNTYHEDFGLTSLVIIKANSVVSTNEYGYYYVQRENSITSIEDEDKEIKKANDVVNHYDNAIKVLENDTEISDGTKLLVKRYYTNTLLLKAKTLKGKEQEKYLKEIKKRKVYKNIKAENLKQLVKRMILKIDIKLYLKMR